MSEPTKVDDAYKKAFNQGYQFAKEVGLSPDALRDLSEDNPRMQAVMHGIGRYNMDIDLDKEKQVIPPLDLDNFKYKSIHINKPNRGKDKGMDMDMDM